TETQLRDLEAGLPEANVFHGCPESTPPHGYATAALVRLYLWGLSHRGAPVALGSSPRSRPSSTESRLSRTKVRAGDSPGGEPPCARSSRGFREVKPVTTSMMHRRS